MASTSISAREFAEICKRDGNVTLIDVRTPVEFQEVHLEIAKNIPLDRLDPNAAMQGSNKEQPIYVICRSGGRGKQACEKFIAAGFPNTVNVEGGTMACLDTRISLVHGKKAMSLERQVRIAAGSLVLTGVVLSWFVHPAFIGLSAFVGAGLVFAGITDTCGMGMILAQMPWNQVSESKSTCATS